MSKNGFPSNQMLKKAVIEALTQMGGSGTTSEINAKVIEILNLSEEIVTLEDESGLGTKLDYRLRWIRTDLKGSALENINRGTWRLKKQHN